LEALQETAKIYFNNYKKRYGKEPSPSSPYAYDQVYVLKHALENAGTVDDTKKVISEITKLAVPSEAVMKYIPIEGKMFDKNGQAYTSNSAFQWQKGKWRYIADLPSDPAAYSIFLHSLRK
jgi:branched-chain amino acid transport system substrate-binding protein